MSFERGEEMKKRQENIHTFKGFCQEIRLYALLAIVALLGWPEWPWLSRIVDRALAGMEGGQ
jgi:hypothetical protein